MFSGSISALVTPMLADGGLDLNSYIELINWHLSCGTSALVVNGTTGESASLTAGERYKLLATAIKEVDGKIPVIAGTGTNSTISTIAETKAAIKAGASACLIVTPYYNRPTQEGMYQHFASIANSCDIPILLYNVPKRTASDLLPETVARLAKTKNIVGIKEATGDIARLLELKKNCTDKFVFLSGDDATMLEFLSAGGHGVISVVANIAPKMVSQLCKAMLEGNITLAEKINDKLQTMYTLLGVESNPIPAKWALYEMGKIEKEIRLPLTQLSKEYQPQIKKAIKEIVNE